MSTLAQSIIAALHRLDAATAQKHSAAIVELIDNVILLDAANADAREQAQAANRRLDRFEAAMREALKRGE